MKRNVVELTKIVMLQEVKKKYKKLLASTPRVDTGLGFFVDGGRENKDDFKSKWELMATNDVTTVRDADNNFHANVTKAQMKTIWKKIVLNGEAVLQEKWQKETAIDSVVIDSSTTEEEALTQLEAIEI